MLNLIRLYPEQVAKQWDIIGYAIEAALPPIVGEVKDRIQSVLTSILAGRLNVYLYHTEEGKTRALMSVAVIDAIDRSEKQMLVYTLYGHGGLTAEELGEGYNLMKDLARGLGCKSIVAYTSVEKFKEFIAKVGGDVSLTFVRMEV